MLPTPDKLDTTQPALMSERDLKAWQIAYDKWLETQRQFGRENEYDEREDH